MENEKIKIPEPPEYFGEYESKLFTRACKFLEELGTLHKADFDQLKLYCFQMGVCHKLEEDIAREGAVIMWASNNGTVNPKINPKQVAYLHAMGLISKIAQYFGFTPAARKKMALEAKKETSDFDGI